MKEITNLKDTVMYYYDMLRDNQQHIIDKLENHLTFYRFSFSNKFKSHEIIYDTATNLLTSAGYVLSKIYENGKYYLMITKVSYLPKKFKKPSVVLFKAEISAQEQPTSYPIELAGVIGDSASGIFTVDLVEVLKVVYPKMQIDVVGDRYNIASGTGYKAEMFFENVCYKDLTARMKFKHKNVAFALSGAKSDEKSNREILGGVLRYCKELFPYEETRFEIARRVLNARKNNSKKKFDKKEYLNSQKKTDEEEKKD